MYHAGNPIGYSDLIGIYWHKSLIGAVIIKNRWGENILRNKRRKNIRKEYIDYKIRYK